MGAELQYTDGTRLRITNRDVERLGEHLRKNNIQLRNAKIGVDGRIIALEGKEVSSLTFRAEARTEARPQIGGPRLMDMRHLADSVVKRAGFKYGGAERLGLITVQAGLDLSRLVNIHGYITEIRERGS